MSPDTRRRPSPRGVRGGGIMQSPFGQRPRPYAPIEVISADQVGAIHDAALTVLRDIGMRILDPRARELYAKAGAQVSDLMV
ncbi:MAG: trimethylamine methyltransferase family protein, partial [Pseudomonadota bacterium]